MKHDLNQTSLWHLIFKFAIIYSLAFISFQLLLFIIAIEQEKFKWLVTFVNLSITFIVLYASLKNIRNLHLEGFISYGKSISIGSKLLLIASPLIALWTYIYSVFIDSETIKASIEVTKKQIIEKGGSEEQISASLDMLNLFTSPTFLVIFSFIGVFFSGFVCLLIVSIFIQKPNPEEEYNKLSN